MFFRRNTAGLVWAGLILFLSIIPKEQVPDGYLFEGFDKVLHGFVYSILSLLLSVGFIRQYRFPNLRQRPFHWAVAVSIVYGILLEVLQGTVFVSRSTEFLDMLANAVGAFVGLLYFRLIYGTFKT